MAWTGRLYPLIAACVLVISGCAGEAPDKTVATPGPTRADRAETESAATVMFFGDSITAGLGVDPDEAFPALIGRRLADEGLPVRVVNAGLSGETTAAGVRRIGWVLDEGVDVFVLELGGNDALRGVDLRSTRANLQAIIDTVRARNPATEIVVAGMQIPPNFGGPYAESFRRIFPYIAEENDAVLIPFVLEGVALVDGMMQADGIHPTAAGHRVIAETVWSSIEPGIRNLVGREGA